MRQIIDPQFQLGEQDIAAIELDRKSRDDIPRLLRGLQFIYTEAAVRERVFAILAEVLPDRRRRPRQPSARTPAAPACRSGASWCWARCVWG